jgi:hypothetical protein
MYGYGYDVASIGVCWYLTAMVVFYYEYGSVYSDCGRNYRYVYLDFGKC